MEASEQNEEVKEAIQAAKATLQQRAALKQGDPIWDDNLILNEIEDILDNREAGEGEDLPGKDGE
jgi:hypothetical protein